MNAETMPGKSANALILDLNGSSPHLSEARDEYPQTGARPRELQFRDGGTVLNIPPEGARGPVWEKLRQPKVLLVTGLSLLLIVMALFSALGGWELLSSWFAPSSADSASKPEIQVIDSVGQTQAEDSEVPVFDPTKISNPYWNLPNTPAPPEDPEAKAWNPSMDDTWRPMLKHPFAYQHYRVVHFVRQNHFVNAESLLFEALNDPKFWVRMEALLGLAELGLSLGSEHFEKIIAQTNPELVSRYLSRFKPNATQGSFYVLRGLVRYVDESGRLKILTLLNLRPSAENSLYLAASMYDPAPRVRAWFESEAIYQNISGQTMSAFKDIATNPNPSAAQKSPVETLVPAVSEPAVEEEPMIEEIEYLQPEDGLPQAPSDSDLTSFAN